MKMNKIYGALSIFLLALTACGGAASPSDESKESKSEPESSEESDSSTIQEGGIITEPTKITYLNTLSYGTLIDNAIESFKKLEPNVEVVNEKISGSYDTIKSQTISDFQTGEYADLVLCYPDHVVDYINNGKAVMLDDYINNKTYGWSKKDKDDIVEAFMLEGQKYPLPGTWSLPYCKSSEAMFYNADILVGLDLSSVDPTINGGNRLSEKYLNSLTWDELFDKLCPAIKAYNDALPDDEKIIVSKTTTGEDGQSTTSKTAIVGYDAVDNLFITLAEQYGFGYTDLDEVTGEGKLLWNNANMRNLVKKFNQAYKNGYFLTKSTNDNNYINTLFTERGVLFSIGSTGGVKYQFSSDNPMKVNVAMIPQADAKNPQLISQGPSLCILDHGSNGEGTNRKLASWLFYKHLVESTNSLKWATGTGYMPVRESVYSSEGYIEYSSLEDITNEKSLERLTALNAQYSSEILDYIFVNPAFKGSSTSRSQVGALLTSIMTEENLTDEKIAELFKEAEDKVKLDM